MKENDFIHLSNKRKTRLEFIINNAVATRKTATFQITITPREPAPPREGAGRGKGPLFSAKGVGVPILIRVRVAGPNWINPTRASFFPRG